MDFDRRARLEFRRAQLGFDGRVRVMREVDDALGLSDLAFGIAMRHARTITFQPPEVAVTGPMVKAILAAIHRLRAPQSCA